MEKVKRIAYVDLEIHSKKKTVLDIGATDDSGAELHSKSLPALKQFLVAHDYICGHNVLAHDLLYMREALAERPMLRWNVIDTLYLSPLMFPKRPYHSLGKDEKLMTGELNNPLADAKKTRELLQDEILAFRRLDNSLQQIYYQLLRKRKEFRDFFSFVDYYANVPDTVGLIQARFAGLVCERADWAKLMATEPVALAYALAVIDTRDRASLTPRWVLKNFPQIEAIMYLLRNRRCLKGCAYCDEFIDAHKALKNYFGFDDFRKFGDEPLQENAVRAAIANKSILVVFPTGGGKSATFQVPALMAGQNVRGLTVVISPLQSLMKDQIDNLEKIGITDAVAINGLLDPIERAKALERVEDGSAAILYISPESLRSRTIKRMLLARTIARFVIDEAHCFSAWGQDFRVDYLYIGEFIKELQVAKQLVDGIPVSCFTATAKQKVVEDICAYFKDKLGLELVLFTTNAPRKNLTFRVLERISDEAKYETLRNLVQEKNCPAIVYVSRTKTAFALADRLSRDGFEALPYHGQMDVREKSANQNAFMEGRVPTIVATSAFGMGVDKKDVGLVVHYEISDSLENYVQEAGRAGRDANITADCYVLYHEDDLNKHLTLLTQTKISSKEIQQIWQAIKGLTRLRKKVSQSALEIARAAGWDEAMHQLETRVKTAIAALEQSGYVKRGQNVTRVFADSILARNVQDAVERIDACMEFDDSDRKDATRIIKHLISSRSKSLATGEDDEAVVQADYMAEVLSIKLETVIRVLTSLRGAGILADAQDLSAFIQRNEKVNKSLDVLVSYTGIERYLATVVDESEQLVNLKELNEAAAASGCLATSTKKIRAVLNFWKICKLAECANASHSANHVHLRGIQSGPQLRQRLERRGEIAKFILGYLYAQSHANKPVPGKEEVLVQFSVHELKRSYEESQDLFKTRITIDDIEEALFYLSRIDALKIEGGFLVLYNPMTIERTHEDLKKRYTNEDYSQLEGYYKNKVQQIHIVGEYARKLIADYEQALQFVNDYFQLNYSRFLAKHFPGARQGEISSNITPAKFRQLFGELSVAQLQVINDKDSKYICVLAGPGSGKTRVLVHKLAALVLMEDVKTEQLLMLTFSRAAATEFKARLRALIGVTAQFIEIKTFHSYCFDLLGKVGSIEKSEEIIRSTIARIEADEVEQSRLAKTVLVIDEAQDMDKAIYDLVKTLIAQNDGMRVIMVGDDDQNIFQFRHSSSEYMARFIEEHGAREHHLLENYRSQANLVDFANQFAAQMQGRLKRVPIQPKRQENGSVRVVSYNSRNLLSPLAAAIAGADLKGTTAALTRTNEQAMRLTTLLQACGVPAKLIQTNDGFKLYDLDEMRYLLGLLKGDGTRPAVDDEICVAARRILQDKYRRSAMLEPTLRMFRAFRDDSGKIKYISDFETFVRESRLEDFYNYRGETIFVSTIHKAKGKEFDNVFLLLEGLYNPTQEDIRQIYVALTRAKKKLAVHYNGTFLDNIDVENLVKQKELQHYPEPKEVSLQLALADVFIDFLRCRQEVAAGLQSGDALLHHKDGWVNAQGDVVFKASKSFMEKQLQPLLDGGYAYTGAKVNFVVWRKHQETDQEFRVILPEISLRKN